MSCDRSAQVHAYHDGQLSPASRAEVETHVAACADCAALLNDLRSVSRLVKTAPLPDIRQDVLDRYYGVWDAYHQRSVLRISSWLTAAAAAVLVGALVLWPRGRDVNTPVADGPAPVVAKSVPQTPTPASGPAFGAWETVALMPPPERRGDRPDELIELAQWISEDLSGGNAR